MKKIGIIVVVCIAFALRFWHIGVVPPSLNADEVAIGYNAYSLLQTGKDEYGIRLPVVFRSFDDYKMPVYVYLTVCSVGIFGLNDFAVRLPSAVCGTLTVLLVYLLVGELIKTSQKSSIIRSQAADKREQTYLPLLSSFLLAISPWHIQFSRSAYEANIADFFIVLGVFLLLKGIQRCVYLVPASVSFVLAVWSYHSCRIFVPVFLIGYAWIYRNYLKKCMVFVVFSCAIGLFLLLPLLRLSFDTQGNMRAMGVSVFSENSTLERSVRWVMQDTESGIFLPFAKLIHNRRIAYLPKVMQGYLEHFSPTFFFSESVLDKYHAPDMGLMYIWELPFMAYGIFLALTRMKNQKGMRLVIWWFLIAPLAASFTQQLPHPVRTLVFLPTPQIFTAIGLIGFFHILQRQRMCVQRVGYVAVCTVACIWSLYYLHQYFVHLPLEYSSAWQYGRKEAVEEVLKRKDEFDHVVVSTSLDVPYIFFLYYLKYDPALYQKNGGTVSGGFKEDRNAFDRYVFRPIKPCEPYDPRVLYVGVTYEVPKQAAILKTIRYKNGSDALYLFTQPEISPACTQGSDVVL